MSKLKMILSDKKEIRADAIKVLMGARMLINDANNWCQGTFARNRYDISVEALGGTACKWCLGGAIGKVYYDIFKDADYEHQIKVLDKIHEILLIDSFARYNDCHSHKQVIDMLDYRMVAVLGCQAPERTDIQSMSSWLSHADLI